MEWVNRRYGAFKGWTYGTDVDGKGVWKPLTGRCSDGLPAIASFPSGFLLARSDFSWTGRMTDFYWSSPLPSRFKSSIPRFFFLSCPPTLTGLPDLSFSTRQGAVASGHPSSFLQSHLKYDFILLSSHIVSLQALHYLMLTPVLRLPSSHTHSHHCLYCLS